MTGPHDRRVWLGGSVLAAALIVALAWFLAIGPTLSSASSLHGQADAAESQNVNTEFKVAKLREQQQNLGKLQQELGAALKALPSESGLPDFTREVNAAARDHGVTVTSIAVGGVGTAGGNRATTTQGSASAGGTKLSIPVTLTTAGGLTKQMAFLHAIQHGVRSALVTSTALTPGQGAKVASLDAAGTMTTQLTVFSAPLTARQMTQLKKLLSGDVPN